MKLTYRNCEEFCKTEDLRRLLKWRAQYEYEPERYTASLEFDTKTDILNKLTRIGIIESHIPGWY